MKKRNVFTLTIVALILTVALQFAAAESKVEVYEPQNFNGDYSEIISSIKSGLRDPIEIHDLVAPNVSHTFKYNPAKPYLINIVTANFQANGAPLTVECEAGKDAIYGGEKTTSMVEREIDEGKNVICAINADFFHGTYRPVGLFVDDGQIFKNPYEGRPVFAVGASGKFYITDMTLDVIVTINGKKFSIPVVNPGDSFTSGAIYSSKYNRNIDLDENNDYYLLTLRSNSFLPNDTALMTLGEKVTDMDKVKLEDNEFLIAVPKSSAIAEAFSGAETNSTIHVFPKIAEVSESLTMAVGGLPTLITDGKIDVGWKRAKIRESFSTTRHPRTAIGFSKEQDRLFLVTVDGRQPGLSGGISLDDLAKIMLDLGCYQAVNLDGGGSTTMFVRGQITNSPSDLNGERTVGNSILLTADAKGIIDSKIYNTIFPRNALLPTSSKCAYRVESVDSNYNPLPGKHAVEIEADDNIGQMNGKILTTAPKPAKGRVRIAGEGKDVRSHFNSTAVEIDNVAEIRFNPEQVLVRSGETSAFNFAAYNAEGRRFYLSPETVELTYPDFVTTSNDNRSITGKAAGKGEIAVKIGNKTANLPVAVDLFKEIIIHSFDTLPAPTDGNNLISGKLFDEGKTSVAIEKDEVKEGSGALEWTYSMQRGGTTAIYLDMNAEIPDEPLRIGLWVKGDGKGQWLRAILKDKDGEKFLIDWTGSGGIFWEDNWRFLEFDLINMTPYFDNPQATPDLPYTLDSIYLAQTQEAMKSDGLVILDAVTAVYAP